MFSMCVQQILLSFRSSFHFQTELAVNTHVAIVGMCNNVSKIREEVSDQVVSFCQREENTYSCIGPNQVGSPDPQEVQ